MSSATPLRSRRGGFTLVELLVVISIIAVMVALLLPAVQNVRQRLNDVRCRNDIDQLSQAVQAFKQSYSIPYFPSKIRLRNDMVYFSSPSVPRQDQLDLDSITYLKRLWPRLFVGTTPGTLVINWCPNDSNASGNSVYVLEGDQCLVFFLGGVQVGNGCLGFAANERNPMDTMMVGQGRKKGPFFEFPVERLVALNHLGFPDVAGSSWPRFSGAQLQRTSLFFSFVDVYGNHKAGQSLYYPATQRGVMPYLYFTATDRSNDYFQYQSPPSPAPSSPPTIFGDCPTAFFGNVQVNTTQAVRPYLSTANKYANDSGFQIVCAGHDGLFGAGFDAWGGPTSAYNGDPKDPGSDDMSNFHPIRLGGAQ